MNVHGAGAQVASFPRGVSSENGRRPVLQSGGFAQCDDFTQSNGPVKVEYFVKHEISQT